MTCPLPFFLQASSSEHLCETLYECFFFTLTSGLRSPGGFGDALVTPSFLKEDALYFWRLVFDLTFFALLIILILNAGAWPTHQSSTALLGVFIPACPASRAQCHTAAVPVTPLPC